MKFKRSFILKSYCTNISVISNDIGLIHYHAKHRKDGKTCVFWSLSKQKEINGFFSLSNIAKRKIYTPVYYRSQNRYCYYEPYDREVYEIVEDKFIPRYKIDSGVMPIITDNLNKMDSDRRLMAETRMKLPRLWNMYESNKYVSFAYKKSNERIGNRFFFNKESKDLCSLPILNTKEFKPVNILGAIEIWGVDENNSFIKVYKGNELISYIKQAKNKNKHFIKLYGHLPVVNDLAKTNLNQNPIIAFFDVE